LLQLHDDPDNTVDPDVDFTPVTPPEDDDEEESDDGSKDGSKDTEEQAKKDAEEQAKKDAEEQARKDAEEKERLAKRAEELAKANATWAAAKKKAREEAEAKAKADKEAKDAKDAERRREKGYDDLNATEKQIFRRMEEMGQDPNANAIRDRYFPDGRRNMRLIALFSSRYRDWSYRDARRKNNKLKLMQKPQYVQR
jgi:hypothetical protein